ncbi:MAG: hypothetical protein HC913_15965 [Microscillaceae bacterium]|nr:hypothetical protein [Microscillaceae bacterium]
MKNPENPFDGLVRQVAQNLNNPKLLSDNKELNLEGVLEENFWQNLPNRYRPAHPSAQSKSKICQDFETELQQLSRQYEKTSYSLAAKDYQNQLLQWEQKVQNARLSEEEKDQLLAQGALARHFSQLWG